MIIAGWKPVGLQIHGLKKYDVCLNCRLIYFLILDTHHSSHTIHDEWQTII